MRIAEIKRENVDREIEDLWCREKASGCGINRVMSESQACVLNTVHIIFNGNRVKPVSSTPSTSSLMSQACVLNTEHIIFNGNRVKPVSSTPCTSSLMGTESSLCPQHRAHHL
ncbi:hypothetical protein RRG08_030061 [Elysia crispata]|uniref:Uncharacterized protein n=1 Tax=Elysia crispata TaxID=231223 RepID=A0AAE0YJ72_9GAST|nr:hypothetical protein RRG08_030061 [Elysia crispata]